MIQPDKRLAVMAGLMTPGGAGVDVGTDHGYLAVYLVQSGRAKRMLATDIRPGPLSSAERCIRENGLCGQIGTMLTDGLTGIELNGMTDILIAGMGGILISEILAARQEELHPLHLILQPMTQAAHLRRWLCGNGFAIECERCAAAGGKVYTIISAGYDGKVRECTPLFALTGRTPEDPGEDAGRYLEMLLRREEKTLAGLLRAETPELKQISEKEQQIRELRTIIMERKADRG